MNNSNVCHEWAAQADTSGKGANIFYDGPVIYSYGRHFPMARILPGNVVLFTSKDYSNTTAKHKGFARRAISSCFTVFKVPNVLAESATDHNSNAAALMGEYHAAHDSALRAINRPMAYATAAREMARTALQYTEVFNIKGELRKTALKFARAPFTPAEDKKLAEKCERARALTEAAEARDLARTIRENGELAEKLEAWAAGTGEYRSGFYRLPCRLRVVGAGAGRLVQTSHGAEVGFLDAVRLLGAWQAGTVEPGQMIGPYTVEHVTPDAIKIGCHRLERAECERVIVPAAAIR